MLAETSPQPPPSVSQSCPECVGKIATKVKIASMYIYMHGIIDALCSHTHS